MKSALFSKKKCPFKVKHTPFLLRKRAFSSIFKSLNANCLPLTGHSKIEKAQSGQRGTFRLYALMGHLSCHICALMATTEPGNCPRASFLIAPEGAQSRAVEALLFFWKRAFFSIFKSLNANLGAQ